MSEAERLVWLEHQMKVVLEMLNEELASPSTEVKLDVRSLLPDGPIYHLGDVVLDSGGAYRVELFLEGPIAITVEVPVEGGP